MTAPRPSPQDLLDLSHTLGNPEYAILGDGNTSARGPENTFWVKASGTSLATVRSEDFVQLSTPRALAMLDARDLSDDQIRAELIACKLDAAPTPLPSIETVMHAALLSFSGVNYVGHTHPTTINMLTCSARFEEALAGRVFPEEVVICGPAPVLVPYVDPGLPLARQIKHQVDEFIVEHGELPRTIYLQSHGFIAIGASARDVRNITMMAVKAARIRLGALSIGPLTLLSQADIDRIHKRSDVHYRQQIIGKS